jgi:hypothetical protein
MEQYGAGVPGQAEQPARRCRAVGGVAYCALASRPQRYQWPHCFPAFAVFSFPLHIPTDIIVGWGVRRAGPTREGGNPQVDLYGELEKSTAAHTNEPKTRAAHGTRSCSGPATAANASDWLQRTQRSTTGHLVRNFFFPPSQPTYPIGPTL